MSSTQSILSKKIAISLLVCFFVLSSSEVLGQVSIAPTSLFFDTQNRFGSLTVSNAGQQAQEVTVSTEFGYPTSENGNLVINRDSLMAEEKSLAGWMKIFPQSFTLQPNQRQVVRFVTQPPQGLESGGYWSRVKISSNPVSPSIETVGEGQVGAQINLVVEQVIAAHFHTENAKTGVEITGVKFQNNGDTGVISISTRQTGNTPFIGSIKLSVTGPAGETVYQTQTTTSVYTQITRSFQIPIADFSPGDYSVRGTITSERRDISSNYLLQIEPVNFVHNFTLE